jgi:hypothetical protein
VRVERKEEGGKAMGSLSRDAIKNTLLNAAIITQDASVSAAPALGIKNLSPKGGNMTKTTVRLTAADIRRVIEKNKAEDSLRIKYHEILAALLKEKWDGKKITQRIVKQFKEKIGEPDAVVYFGGPAQLWYLELWGSKDFPQYEGRLRMFVGYTHDLLSYPAEVFEQRDISYGNAAKERNEQRDILLANEEFLENTAQTINDLNNARSRYEQWFNEDFVDRHDFAKLAEAK